MKKLLNLSLVSALLLTNSCQKQIDNYLNNQTNNGSMTAIVDGHSFTASHVSVTVLSGYLSVSGEIESNNEEISLIIPEYNSPSGIYPIDSVNTTYQNEGIYEINNTTAHYGNWGEIVLTSTGSKSATGTFHFTTKEGNNITGGYFNIHWD